MFPANYHYTLIKKGLVLRSTFLVSRARFKPTTTDTHGECITTTPFRLFLGFFYFFFFLESYEIEHLFTFNVLHK